MGIVAIMVNNGIISMVGNLVNNGVILWAYLWVCLVIMVNFG